MVDKQQGYQMARGLGYFFVLIGAFLGFYQYGLGLHAQAVRIFAFLGILPLSFCAFLWHTWFAGHVHPESSHFFENEAGGANLGVGVALLLAWILNARVDVLSYLLLWYFVYLLVAAICHGIYHDYKKGLRFLPVLIFIVFFAVLGLKTGSNPSGENVVQIPGFYTADNARG